jgi:hypothetical protein
MNRRRFLAAASTCAAGRFVSRDIAHAQESVPDPRYKIGVCDWMILKRQRLGAFPLAKEIGVDGVEVDMGSLGDRETFDNQLANPATRQQFLDEAKRLDLEICSLAMSGFRETS